MGIEKFKGKTPNTSKSGNKDEYNTNASRLIKNIMIN